MDIFAKQPVEIIKNIIRQGIRDISSIKEARAAASKINSKLESKIPSNELKDLVLDSFGFRRLNISSLILVEDGFFEISYIDNLEFSTWNKYIILESTALHDDKGNIILESEADFYAKTLNYIVFISKDGKCSLYKSTKSGIVLVITSNLGFIIPHMEIDIVEASDGSVYFAIYHGIAIIKKYDGKELSDLPLSKEGKTEISTKYLGLGYHGIYAGKFFYPYDTFIKTPAGYNEDMISRIISDNNFGIDIFRMSDMTSIFMKDNKELWRIKDPEGTYVISQMFYISNNKVYDLRTGDQLLDISKFISRSTNAIIDISLKGDKTGYYVWVKSDVLNYEYKLQVIKLRGTNPLRIDPQMPETPFYPSITSHGVTIKDYYDDINEPYKTEGTPFVVSKYSLYPYYHKLLIGENILVKGKGEDEEYYVTGYSTTGHRIFRRYQPHTKYNNFFIYSEDPKIRQIIYNWLAYFLSDNNYIVAAREEKINIIQKKIQTYKNRQQRILSNLY